MKRQLLLCALLLTISTSAFASEGKNAPKNKTSLKEMQEKQVKEVQNIQITPCGSPTDSAQSPVRKRENWRKYHKNNQ